MAPDLLNDVPELSGHDGVHVLLDGMIDVDISAKAMETHQIGGMFDDNDLALFPEVLAAQVLDHLPNIATHLMGMHDERATVSRDSLDHGFGQSGTTHQYRSFIRSARAATVFRVWW
ncbi:MAG: hypothetical protein ABS35_15410 [Kaistia sp. SCN 65-12]|nr:MAG: hypothetical protein ABS35_15410 [Kaistia sp. SCN 65-12]